MEKKIPTQFRFWPDVVKKLSTFSEQSGFSMTEIAELAIRELTILSVIKHKQAIEQAQRTIKEHRIRRA